MSQQHDFESESESVQDSNNETLVSNKKISILEPLKTNRFLIIRLLYHFLRSVWIVAMVVGGFIAWIISMLFI